MIVNEIVNWDEFHLIDKVHKYRYERKFTVPSHFKLKATEQLVRANTFLFREVYHERRVNNIYFDTLGYNDYFDNVLGVANRKKTRIRWYGETFGKNSSPVLEIKIKKGLIGDKWSYGLDSFELDNTFTNECIQKVFKDAQLPKAILESTKQLTPTLLNSYSRKYFLSADGNFRITIDFNLKYHRIDNRFNNFSFVPKYDENIIVELKYDLNRDNEANSITTQFPFRLNKNSKYVNGVNSFKHFPQ